jgi:methylmalonyl-CoA mutase N-terminal domain/subunit
MPDVKDNGSLKQKYSQWREKVLKPVLEKRQIDPDRFPKQFYSPLDIRDVDFEQDIGFPGEYPFTAGIHPTAEPHLEGLTDRARYSGYGTPEDTRDHFNYLISQGFHGLSLAFDLPSQIGYDSDHPLAEGEVGRVGVALNTLEDLETIFEAYEGKVPLDRMSPSFTTNAQASIILAMYIALAEKKGVQPENLRGTIQNDILKEYVSRGTYIFPPAPSMRLVADTVVYTANHLPLFNPISICGYHLREAGATAVQELGFMFSHAIAYIEAVLDQGLAIDRFAPRFSFLLGCGQNFFEEIAKYRAARKMWARIMRERFGAKEKRSLLLRGTAGIARYDKTVQKPFNNIVRGTIQAMATLLGGTMAGGRSVPYDEALGLYTETARRIADDTPRILRLEARLGDVIDPLAGSYYVESLTRTIEEEAWKIIEKVDSLGGAVKAIEDGYIQAEIAESAYGYQQALERGERILVGVNKYVAEDEPMSAMEVDRAVEEKMIEALKRFKASRDVRKVSEALAGVRKASEGTHNLMPPIIEAVKAKATVGEICHTLREVFGEYKAPQAL